MTKLSNKLFLIGIKVNINQLTDDNSGLEPILPKFIKTKIIKSQNLANSENLTNLFNS